MLAVTLSITFHGDRTIITVNLLQFATGYMEHIVILKELLDMATKLKNALINSTIS